MSKILSWKVIRIGLFVGTLDILAAFIQTYARFRKAPNVVLRFIASAVFGDDAVTRGKSMLLWGLAFHYTIAMIFTIFFFLIVSKIPSMLKHKIRTGIGYGFFIWCFMQFFVLPFTKIPQRPILFESAVVAIGILIICIGMPLAFMASDPKPVEKK
jgi:uncharacterized membrane protein YagU involved in acid resistance